MYLQVRLCDVSEHLEFSNVHGGTPRNVIFEHLITLLLASILDVAEWRSDDNRLFLPIVWQ